MDGEVEVTQVAIGMADPRTWHPVKAVSCGVQNFKEREERVKTQSGPA